MLAPGRARILFRADASAAIGIGHVMRCLTLADALDRRGFECVFFCDAATPSAVPALAASRHSVEILASPRDANHLATLAKNFGFTAAVIDHYGLGEEFELPLRMAVGKLVVIDDLPTRRHYCDLLLDQTLDRRASEYSLLLPDWAQCLCGLSHALLRPQFAAARPDALARRARPTPAKRLLVSLGGTDPDDVTGAVLEAIARIDRRLSVDVVMGAGAPALERVRARISAMADVQLHVNVADMAALMSAADLAIGAGGTSSWERCCLGLPTIVLTIADNQRDIVAKLAASGAAMAAPARPPTELAELIGNLAENPEMLGRMSSQAASLCDGLGADRVAAAIDALIVRPSPSGASRP